MQFLSILKGREICLLNYCAVLCSLIAEWKIMVKIGGDSGGGEV